MKHKGKFIVVEGLDGSGKSTQALRIVSYVNEPQNKLVFGYRGVHLTREPTDSLIGGLIRSQLKHDWHSSPTCLQLLFAADRAYHLEKEVLPLLEKGVVVVSDRYFFSSFAYGALNPKDAAWLFAINSKFLVPDLTFFIDVAPKTCIERIKGDRFEVSLFEKEQELARVRRNYKFLLSKFKNIVVVQGDRSADEVTDDIIGVLNVRLQKS